MKKKKKIKKITKAMLLKKEKREKKKLLLQRDLSWRLAIKMGDNWTCQICGKYVKENVHNCHAHHILDKKNYPEQRHDLVNGITLCYRCHKIGARSPHMDAIWFSYFMIKNRPKQYFYLLRKAQEKQKGKDELVTI